MFIKPCMVLFFTGFSHEIPSCTLYSSSQSFFDFWNIPSTTLSPPTPFMRAAVSPGPGLKVTVTQLCLTVCYPMDCTVHWIVQARILEWVAVPFSRGSFQPDFQLGIEPRSPTLQADSLSAELQVKLGLVLLLMRMRHIFLILSFYWCLISIW